LSLECYFYPKWPASSSGVTDGGGGGGGGGVGWGGGWGGGGGGEGGGRRGGKCPPSSLDVGPFLEMSPLNSASFAF